LAFRVRLGNDQVRRRMGQMTGEVSVRGGQLSYIKLLIGAAYLLTPLFQDVENPRTDGTPRQTGDAAGPVTARAAAAVESDARS